MKTLIFIIAFSQVTLSAPLPPDAQKELNKYGGKLTTELILLKAMQSSDSFRAVIADKYSIESDYYSAKSVSDISLTASGGQTTAESASETTINGVSYDKLESKTYSLGASTYFQTGTAFSVELEQEYGKTEVETSSDSYTTLTEGWESTLTFELSQSLTKDIFGYGTRRLIEAGELNSEAAKATLQGEVSVWAIDILNLYYSAWRLQNQVRAADDNYKRRKRLLDITKVKVRRGTAERPDLLQTESALLSAEIQRDEAKQSLLNIWRDLVIQLNFPRTWLKIDPIDIPLELDEPEYRALTSCGKREALNPPPKDSYESLAWKKKAKAANLLKERAENAMWPDLQLVGQYFSNGLDEDQSSNSLDDATAFDNTGWYIGGTLSFPLGRYSEKSDLASATATAAKAEAMSTFYGSRLETLWGNECQELYRLRDAVRMRARALGKQAERVRLEEKRFSVGRGTLLGVIQAGDDATLSDIDLRKSEVSMRLKAWDILKLKNQIPGYLEQLEKKAKN